MKKMIVESTLGLGEDALQNPKKYNGFMGISILHRFFARKRMSYYFQWGSHLFKEFVIVLMDDPDKYNFMVFRNLSPEDALTKARTISDEIKAGYEKEINKLGLTNVRVVQFRDYCEEYEYKELLGNVAKHTMICEPLKKNLMQLMEIGIGQKIRDFAEEKDIKNEDIFNYKSVLFNYLLEELSSILYMTKQGFPIEVDPTIELTTKTMIYNRDCPELLVDISLPERGHVYVHPENIEKNSY